MHDLYDPIKVFVYKGNSMYAFYHPALAQARDYSRSNYTCTQFLRYDTPVHTSNKWSLDIKHDMRQRGMGVNKLKGCKIASSKYYWWVNALKNGKHNNEVERCRRVTMCACVRACVRVCVCVCVCKYV